MSTELHFPAHLISVQGRNVYGQDYTGLSHFIGGVFKKLPFCFEWQLRTERVRIKIRNGIGLLSVPDVFINHFHPLIGSIQIQTIQQTLA